MFLLQSPRRELPPTSCISHHLLGTSSRKLYFSIRLSSSKGARTSLPGVGGEGDAAGEGHHTQAGQPTPPRLAPLSVYLSFFFNVSKVLCLNSHLRLPTARQGANPEAAKAVWGGTVVSSPTSQGRGGSTGSPRSVSAVPGTPLSSVSCGAASPKMPLVSSTDSWHDKPAQRLVPTAAPGRGGALPGTRRVRRRGFGSGKAFPCCKAAIVHRHEELYRRSYLNACGNNFPV